MKAYKYVPEEFAESTSKGVFSIGTAAFYRSYEGPLVDQRDEAVEYTLGDGEVRDVSEFSDGQRARIQSVGLQVPRGNNVLFAGVTLRKVLRPAYMLCLSRGANNKHLLDKGLTAVFEIEDVRRLAHVISFAHSTILYEFHIQPVSYERRVFDILREPEVAPDPFVKDVAFANEDELRVRWGPIGASNPPRFLTFAPLAQSLMRRVR